MSQMPTRACTRCGAMLSANQRFCTRCGATIDVVAGNFPGSTPPGGANFPPGPPPLPVANVPGSLSPQFAGGQPVPSVPGTPSLSQPAPPVPGTPSFSQPVHSSAFPAQSAQPSSMHVPQMQGQPALPQQVHMPPAAHGMPAPPAVPQAQASAFPGHAVQAASSHAPSAPPPHVQPPLPAHPALPGASSLHGAGSVAARSARRLGMRVLLTKPVIAAMAVVVLAGSGAGIAYSMYRASAPTSFVIATDRGNNQIMRIDLATRKMTVLLSNKVLPGSPDSAVFINDTQMLIDFPGNGEVGMGDIQNGSYASIGKSLGGSLRDMALRPDGSAMLIADAGGTILEYHVDTKKISTFAQNIGGVQGLAFDSNGALYAAVGGQVIQLDPATGKQIKTFTLPGGSDGMAYDGHRHTLDLAIGSSIVALDPQMGATSILIDGIAVPDGLSVDRGGNLFIAAAIGVLELNTSNQLLIVGTNTNGITWDDVAPLSGSGAANY